MTDRPFRLRILDALTDALREVTPANGYTHDLSETVWRGRTLFGDSDALPLVSILEDVRPQESFDRRTVIRSGRKLVAAVAGLRARRPRTSHRSRAHATADVKRRLAIEARRKIGREARGNILNLGGGTGLGNEILAMKIGAGFVRPPDGEVSDTAFFWLTVTFDLVEDIENPFV